MSFTEISLDTWPRRDVFQHFIQDVRCVITITAEVDVTSAVAFCRSNGYRLYPTFLYLVARAVNRRDELKMGYDDAGKLVLWHSVSPSYVVFHPEDELFTRLVTEYSPEFKTFYERVVDDMTRHQDKRAFEVEYTVRNTFDNSCLPWLHYTACDLHVYDSGTYLAPVITWGKYENKDGKLLMPLTMQIHHAVADGFHVARFFSDIQHEMVDLTE